MDSETLNECIYNKKIWNLRTECGIIILYFYNKNKIMVGEI